jgi:hypothetical protein
MRVTEHGVRTYQAFSQDLQFLARNALHHGHRAGFHLLDRLLASLDIGCDFG